MLSATRWIGWEWLHIYGLMTKTHMKRVLLSRFGNGLGPPAGFIELDRKTPAQFVALTLQQLELGFVRDAWQRLGVVRGWTVRLRRCCAGGPGESTAREPRRTRRLVVLRRAVRALGVSSHRLDGLGFRWPVRSSG